MLEFRVCGRYRCVHDILETWPEGRNRSHYCMHSGSWSREKSLLFNVARYVYSQRRFNCCEPFRVYLQAYEFFYFPPFFLSYSRYGNRVCGVHDVTKFIRASNVHFFPSSLKFESTDKRNLHFRDAIDVDNALKYVDRRLFVPK